MRTGRRESGPADMVIDRAQSHNLPGRHGEHGSARTADSPEPDGEISSTRDATRHGEPARPAGHDPRGYLHSGTPRYIVTGILGILTTAVLLLLWTTNTRVEEMQRQHEELVGATVDGTAEGISLHLADLRRTLALFAESRRSLLMALADRPEDAQVLETLAADVERVFPEAFAFTLADANGSLLVDDFDGAIEEICRESIMAFSRDALGDRVSIHPNPHGYHFDLMTRVGLGRHGEGIFFVSFGPQTLTPLLTTHRLPSYSLLLLHRNIEGLVEMGESGSREVLGREFFLNDAEIARVAYEAPVETTLWKLVALPDEKTAIGSRAARIWREHVWEVLLLVLVGMTALWQLKRSAGRELAQNRLLSAVNRAESRFITDDDPIQVFSDVLSDLLALTRSEYGFLAEVVHQAGGEPYLKIYAISNSDHDRQTEPFFQGHAETGAEIRTPDALLGRIVTKGEHVIANDPIPDPQSSVPGRGETVLKAFLGAPLFHGAKLVGMIGLANRAGGYGTQDVQYLQPMLRSCGNLFGAMRNSEQRMKAEAALRDSETRERAVLETVVDGIITSDDAGNIETFNPAAERIFGYRAEEVVGHNISILGSDEHRRVHLRYLKRLLAGDQTHGLGGSRELTGRRKDGTTFAMELTVSEMRLGDERKFTGLVRDITRRRNAERALRETTALQRAILNSANHSIIATDRDGTILVFNVGAQRMLGYSAAEMVGQQTPERIHDPAEVEERARELSEELGRVVKPGFEVFTAQTLSGSPDEREWTYIRKDGVRIPVQLSVTALRDETDSVTGFLGIASDITERKKIERMKSEFIATVSHELRTPLTSIRGSLGLVAGGALGELPPQAKSLLTIASNNSERLGRLINDILDIEKIESGRVRFELVLQDIRPVVEHAIQASAGYAEEYSVSFDLTQPDEPCLAHIDPDRITQVIMNLLSNAAKFSPRGERVEIRVEALEACIRVRISDRGNGLPEEFHPRVFEKFAQADASDTREKGGTGLGLSICKAIVEKHRGHIDFETMPECGTSFYFDLPATHGDTLALVGGTNHGEASQGVLICEDDPEVAQLLALVLQGSGLRTDIAYSAGEAKTRLRKGDYVAMTLDLDLPDQDGVSLIRELRENDRTRSLPIIVVSAHAEQGRDDLGGGVLGVIDWIAKPVERQRLVDALSTVAGDGDATRHILHVERDPDIVHVVASILGEGFEVTHASNLEQARRLLESRRYHLIILDVGLADGSGLSLVPLVKTLACPVPIVVFSGLELDVDMLGGVAAALTKSRTTNTKLVDTMHRAMATESARLLAKAHT